VRRRAGFGASVYSVWTPIRVYPIGVFPQAIRSTVRLNLAHFDIYLDVLDDVEVDQTVNR